MADPNYDPYAPRTAISSIPQSVVNAAPPAAYGNGPQSPEDLYNYIIGNVPGISQEAAQWLHGQILSGQPINAGLFAPTVGGVQMVGADPSTAAHSPYLTPEQAAAINALQPFSGGATAQQPHVPGDPASSGSGGNIGLGSTGQGGMEHGPGYVPAAPGTAGPPVFPSTGARIPFLVHGNPPSGQPAYPANGPYIAYPSTGTMHTNATSPNYDPGTPNVGAHIAESELGIIPATATVPQVNFNHPIAALRRHPWEL